MGLMAHRASGPRILPSAQVMRGIGRTEPHAAQWQPDWNWSLVWAQAPQSRPRTAGPGAPGDEQTSRVWRALYRPARLRTAGPWATSPVRQERDGADQGNSPAAYLSTAVCRPRADEHSALRVGRKLLNMITAPLSPSLSISLSLCLCLLHTRAHSCVHVCVCTCMHTCTAHVHVYPCLHAHTPIHIGAHKYTPHMRPCSHTHPCAHTQPA